jgi:holo-[acyl-carrier protein] synthase
VEIDRIRSLAERNPRFLNRLFSEEEIRYCQGKKLRWQHFAVRFAAKEAVWKALGRDGLSLKSIEVRRDELGRPSVAIEGRPEPGISISLSHGTKTAMAVALALPGIR